MNNTRANAHPPTTAQGHKRRILLGGVDPHAAQNAASTCFHGRLVQDLERLLVLGGLVVDFAQDGRLISGGHELMLSRLYCATLASTSNKRSRASLPRMPLRLIAILSAAWNSSFASRFLIFHSACINSAFGDANIVLLAESASSLSSAFWRMRILLCSSSTRKSASSTTCSTDFSASWLALSDDVSSWFTYKILSDDGRPSTSPSASACSSVDLPMPSTVRSFPSGAVIDSVNWFSSTFLPNSSNVTVWKRLCWDVTTIAGLLLFALATSSSSSSKSSLAYFLTRLLSPSSDISPARLASASFSLSSSLACELLLLAARLAPPPAFFSPRLSVRSSLRESDGLLGSASMTAFTGLRPPSVYMLGSILVSSTWLQY
uniref:Uncharacterized protein n=1 Tax=Globisporangium ultimum (strain ATCC 200006 / CBS 805.95 / DAOM BR144) TaxID=431595 RepID=K3WCX0_GLOUD